MKRYSRSILCAVIVAIFAPEAHGLNIEAFFTASNADFTDERTEETRVLDPMDFQLGFRAKAALPVSDAFFVEIEAARDSVLRNILFIDFVHRDERITTSVGPYFGVLNELESPWQYFRPGLSAMVQVRFAHRVSFSFRSLYPFSRRLTSVGDYVQESARMTSSVYLSNAVLSAEYKDTAYTSLESTGTQINERQEYAFVADLHQKNTPYRIRLTFAYHDRTLTFASAPPDTPEVHSTGSLVLGPRLELDFAHFTYILDLNNAVYTFGKKDLIGVFNNEAYFFSGSTGLRLRVQ